MGGLRRGSRPLNLQYRTAKDDHVRQSHHALDETTLPLDDPFWDSYLPPNGWRCRCNTVEVRKGKYAESDSATAQAAGATATTQLDKNGKNKLAIFRFNPGKEKVLFPPAHPYTKVKGASAATAATSVAAPKHEIANLDELNDKMKELASAHPEWFDKGFKELKVETGAGNNGSTDGRGNIWLTNQRINHVIDAFNNISNGNKNNAGSRGRTEYPMARDHAQYA